MKNFFVIQDEESGDFITSINGALSMGHDNVLKFETWGKASDFNQNYGPNFVVVEVHI